MNKTELKPGIFIEGFNTSKEMVREEIGRNKELEFRTTLYEGKTSEIPEELAKECVEWKHVVTSYTATKTGSGQTYKDYSEEKLWYVYTAKESIQSACPNEFCIIYRTN